MFSSAHVPRDRIVLRPATFDRAGSGSPAGSIADSDEGRELIISYEPGRSADYLAASSSSGATCSAGRLDVRTVRGNVHEPTGTICLNEEPPESAERTSLRKAARNETNPEPPTSVDRTALLEPEPALQSHGPKKRRKKGLRFTRVKNERKKKAAEAKAEQAARRTERKPRRPANAGGPRSQRRSRPEPEQAEVDWTTRRMTRAVTRAQPEVRVQEPAEPAQPARRSRRKNKGKQTANDEPESGSGAKKSLKRRREDEDDEHAVETLVNQDEPGPSRPTRRTRRRLDSEKEDVKPKLGPRGQAAKLALEGAIETKAFHLVSGRRRYSNPDPVLEPSNARPRFSTPERSKPGGPVQIPSQPAFVHRDEYEAQRNARMKVEEEA